MELSTSHSFCRSRFRPRFVAPSLALAGLSLWTAAALAACAGGSREERGPRGGAAAHPAAKESDVDRYFDELAAAFPALAHVLAADSGEPAGSLDRGLTVDLPGLYGDPIRIATATSSVPILKLRPLEATHPVEVERSGGRAVYREAHRGADAIWVAGEGRVEELILLDEPVELARLRYELDAGPAASLIPTRDGRGLVVAEDSGRARLRLPPPYALDARGELFAGALVLRGEILEVIVPLQGATFPVLVDPVVEVPVWEERVAPSTPIARIDHAAAYDSGRGVTVLFGGWAAPVFGLSHLDDTWEWDGATWTMALPGINPLGRYDHAMAYDSARGMTVLTGGSIQVTVSANDSWEWDGIAWTGIPSAGGATERKVHAMAYDSARAVTVLFGGEEPGSTLADTWEWDGTVWTDVTPASGPSPGPRVAHAMAYDSARGVTVLFGGHRPGSWLGDAWEWDGATWTDVTPAWSPAPRMNPAMVYDEARGRTILFGGYWGPGPTFFDDTWEWNGTTWTEMLPAVRPPGRRQPAMAYDSARDVVVLFGGGTDSPVPGLLVLGDTWEYRVETYLADGTPCTAGDDCLSGFCTDDVCCSAAACPACQRCDATGSCSATAADGEPCDDGDACTERDGCAGGLCVGLPLCDDDNPCTVDQCDATLPCSFSPLPDGALCSDNDLCNGDETCQSGSCTPGPPLACDDGDPCTTDTCDPSAGCQNVWACSGATDAGPETTDAGRTDAASVDGTDAGEMAVPTAGCACALFAPSIPPGSFPGLLLAWVALLAFRRRRAA